MRRVLFLVVLGIGLVSCGGSSSGGAKKTAKDTVVEYQFKIPQVPMYIQTQQEASAWMLENFWADLSPTDSLAIGSEALKQAFGMWAMAMYNLPRPEAVRRIVEQIKKYKDYPAMHLEFIRLGEGYFGDPTSEIRQDTLFLALLDYVLESDKISELEKIRPKELKKLTLQNQIGSVGPDLSWVNINGQVGSVYSKRPQMTLLMFYTPGCVSCSEIFRGIDQDPTLQNLIHSGKLRVVALYTDGDKKVWEEYAKQIPPYIENGFMDEKFNKDKPYAVRATPSLFLLDKNRKVMLKDGVNHLEILYNIK